MVQSDSMVGKCPNSTVYPFFFKVCFVLLFFGEAFKKNLVSLTIPQKELLQMPTGLVSKTNYHW